MTVQLTSRPHRYICWTLKNIFLKLLKAKVGNKVCSSFLRFLESWIQINAQTRMLDKMVLHPSETPRGKQTHLIVDMLTCFQTTTLPRQELVRNPYTTSLSRIL